MSIWSNALSRNTVDAAREAPLIRQDARRRNRISAIPVMLTLITLFLASFAGIFGYFLIQGTQQTASRLEERSAAAAQIVGTNAAWITEVARQTLRRVDTALGPSLLRPGEDLQLAVEN